MIAGNQEAGIIKIPIVGPGTRQSLPFFLIYITVSCILTVLFLTFFQLCFSLFCLLFLPPNLISSELIF
jgi:hypothetical protein